MLQKLPDLKTLSEEQKDAVIVEVFDLLQKMRAEAETLKKRVQELEARLSKDSHNSSKPPSTEGFKKTKSQRQSSGKKPGGQKGHPGSTLRQMANPDRIIDLPLPDLCDACGATLAIESASTEARQVIDVAPLQLEITEHRLRTLRCSCGKAHQSACPPEVSEAVQYGPRIQALAVYLNGYQLLPVRRTADLIQDLWGASISPACVDAYVGQAGTHLNEIVSAIRDALSASAVVHFDESGFRVAGKLHWLHTAATSELSWYGHHQKRGMEAFEDFNILPRFTGTAVHDGLAAYREYPCQHGLCNSHHLRELIWIFETTGQAWAQQMIDLLVEAKEKADTAGNTPLDKNVIAFYHERFLSIVAVGKVLNPERLPDNGSRRRVKQSEATNLLRRFERYRYDILRFLSDPAVPFDNNLAERAIRMPKLKQKISGAFRSDHGADTFCIVRSYLATLRKQGMDLFRALFDTFQGKPPAPSLSSG